MKVGVGSDHGGFAMKQELARLLAADGHEVVDFGNKVYKVTELEAIRWQRILSPILGLHHRRKQ